MQPNKSSFALGRQTVGFYFVYRLVLDRFDMQKYFSFWLMKKGAKTKGMYIVIHTTPPNWIVI